MTDIDKDRIVDDAVAESRNPWTRLTLVVVAVLSVVALGIAVYNLFHDAERAEDRADVAEAKLPPAQDTVDNVLRICREGGAAKQILLEQAPGACEDAREADENIEETDDENPEVIVGDPGPQGPRGEPGPPPSPDAVEFAVRRYCAVTGCRGPPGESVSPSEVAAAVALYCDARGECSGPTGPAGEEGSAGPAGPAPTSDQIALAVSNYCAARDSCSGPRGETGRPPTVEEIAAAVNNYCATHDQCQGAPGPQGAAGEDGEDAFPFQFTFTVPASSPLGEDRTYTCTVNDPDDPVTCEETS